jgi:general secretion pathway protein E
MSTPANQPTATELEALVHSARHTAQTTHSALWPHLLSKTGADERLLTSMLSSKLGVASFSAEIMLSSSTKLRRLGAGFSCEVAADKTYLVFEDPWSSEALQYFSRSNNGRTVLAIAQATQLALLGAQLGGAAFSANPATSPAAILVSTSKTQSSPVVAFVDDAIVKAYADGASDIHFETDRQGIGIKYRLDGVMALGSRLNEPQRAEEVISRVKVLAQLDITERRRPQDGRIHWTHPSGDSIDLRVSIMPSIFGEDAVLRLLDKAQLRHSAQSISLDALGFDSLLCTALRDLASRPHGMLLITGPTGSGKTTTVYAALSEVNDGLEKIITIEDPVEYELPGVLQIPVNEQKGLTFATGLRSILRHDPDKILVGEIRDAETAEIAIQSALTGHPVFTTVHANSLFDVLGRFQHFGIDPFALASALNGVVVQRLLRRLCPHCHGWRKPTLLETDKLEALDQQIPTQIPVVVGCDQCRNTGYKGRFVVAEVHQLSDAMRDLIVQKQSMTALKDMIYKNKEHRLLARALAKVVAGETSLEEVNRVVGLV